MSRTISVIVADDHPLYRDGVIRTLAAESDIEVIGNAADADEAVRLVCEQLPDVALLDVSMPGDGLSAVKRIAEHCPVVKVIMLTVSEDEHVVQEALNAGAKGYVLKGVSGPELVKIVRDVQSGEAYITPTLAAAILRSDRSRDEEPIESLTEREQEILKQLARGSSNKQIAAALSIGERTVKHHVTNILQKLQVRNRVEAALIAQQAMRGLEP